MSKQKQPAAAPTVDIPCVHAHPAVAKAAARHDAIAADLAAVRRARAATETELDARPNTPDHEIEGRLIAAGESTEAVARLRDNRHKEKALVYALGLVAADVDAATELAKRELTAEVRATVFAPAAREAVAAWLAAGKVADRFNAVVADLHARGLGNGMFNPFADKVPLGRADAEWFAAFARELIDQGFTDAATVNAAFPGAVA